MQKNGFKLDKTVKLTIKIDSCLSNIKNCYYLKIRITMCHRQFLRIKSHDRECVKTNCNDRNNSFDFACRKWYSDKKLPLKREDVFFYHL